MPMKDYLNNEVTSCSPDCSIKDAAGIMREKDVGALLVLEGDDLKGIITDRDLVIHAIAEDGDLSAQVCDYMNTDVKTASWNDGVFKVANIMRENAIRRVPIVDENEKVVGLVSFGDLFELFTEELRALQSPTAPKHNKISREAA